MARPCLDRNRTHASSISSGESRRRCGSPSAMRLPAVAAAALLVLAAPAAVAELKPGDVLGPENWEEARGLLPDEFLDSYKRGDFRHEVAAFDVERIGDDPVFHAAMEANRGRYAIAADGSIVDARTGQAPDYIYAWPFPDIDRERPAGGAQDRVELLLHDVLRRQRPLSRRPAVDLAQRARPRRRGRQLLQALRRPAPALPRARRRPRAADPDVRRGARAGRRERHPVAVLALPRRRQARFELDLRAGAAPRAPGVAVQPLGRVPRLRPDPGRRRLLRRQGAGLHLEAGRRAGPAGAVRQAVVHRSGAARAPARAAAGGWRFRAARASASRCRGGTPRRGVRCRRY